MRLPSDPSDRRKNANVSGWIPPQATSVYAPPHLIRSEAFLQFSCVSTIPNGHCSHGKNKSIVTEAAHPFDRLKEKGFEIEFHAHAHPILFGEFSEPLAELATVLDRLELPIPEIIGSGGGETKFPQRTRKCLAELGWKKHNFEVTKVVDGTPRDSTSHEVDHVRGVRGVGTLVCEIEWNNKDPFFDRDLENFKRLHAEGAISILITRG